MKLIFNLFALFLSLCVQAQQDSLKHYVVDYKLEYDVIYPQDSTKNHKAIYYINSKRNSFFATARPNKEGKLTIYFTDNDGKSFDGPVTQNDLALIEKTGIAQKTFFDLKNPYKYQINNYDYFAKGDTLINGHKCSAYLLRSTKPKREKRKKFFHEVYYFDTAKKMAPLLIHATAYEIWKARKSVPDGLLVQKDGFTVDNIYAYSERLLTVTQVNFTIILVGESVKYPKIVIGY